MVIFADTSSNTSIEVTPETPNLIIILCNIIFSLWIIVSNSLLLRVMVTHTIFHGGKLTKMIIVNLAITDILMGFTSLISTCMVYNNIYIIRTHWFCAARQTVTACLLMTSLLLLTSMTVMKIIHIKWPLSYNRLFNRKTVLVMFICIWFICILFSTVFLISFPKKELMVIACVERTKATPFLTPFYCLAIVCLVVMCISHAYFVFISNRHIQCIARQNAMEAAILRKENKATKCFARIIISMVICYIPNILIYYVIILFDLALTPAIIFVWKLTAVFLVMASSVNFIVLNVYNKELRKSLTHVFLKCKNTRTDTYCNRANIETTKRSNVISNAGPIENQ